MSLWSASVAVDLTGSLHKRRVRDAGGGTWPCASLSMLLLKASVAASCACTEESLQGFGMASCLCGRLAAETEGRGAQVATVQSRAVASPLILAVEPGRVRYTGSQA